MPEVTYLEALRQGLWEEMERDERVFMLGEDIGAYGGAFKVTDGFQKKFGEARVIDTPISEAAIVGAAAGAAHMGMRPVAEMQFIDFISCAYDMLTNYVATARYRAGLATPIVVRGPCGGYVRGGPFHSQNPEMYYVHTPGLKVVAPGTTYDAKGLIKAAIRDPNPVLVLENEILYGQSFDVPKLDDFVLPIGKARIHKQGKDVTIVSFGIGMTYAIKAEAELRGMGINAEIIDLRSLIPLDLDTIVRSVIKTGRCAIVHEATRTSGFGAELSALIQERCFYHLEAPVVRVTGWDTPYPHAQEWDYFPGPDRVGRALIRLMET